MPIEKFSPETLRCFLVHARVVVVAVAAVALAWVSSNEVMVVQALVLHPSSWHRDSMRRNHRWRCQTDPSSASSRIECPSASFVLTSEDRALLDQFEGCTLPAEEWTHAAHVHVAWTILCLEEPSNHHTKAPSTKARHQGMRMLTSSAYDRIRRGIQTFNSRVLGRPSAFHETITAAFAHIIWHRMQTSVAAWNVHQDSEDEEPMLTWDVFCHLHPDLVEQSINVLLTYYTKERLFSEQARERFLEPDLSSLP